MLQSDGAFYPIYLNIFNKACKISQYRRVLEGCLPGFLNLIISHMNHSVESYGKAVRHGRSGNKRRFKPLVRSSGREPMASRVDSAGICVVSKFGARFPLGNYVTNVPEHILEPISLAKASQTWANYRVGMHHLQDYAQRFDFQLTFPLPTCHIIGLITYLFRIRRLAPGTVLNYLSGVKIWHTMLGVGTSNFDQELVRIILRGYRNLALTSLISPRTKSVITWQILRIFQEELGKLPLSILDKQVYWTAGLVAFWGSMRCGELLQGQYGFDEIRVLNWSKVVMKDLTHAVIYVALPKNLTDAKPSQHVDLFNFPLAQFDPIHNLCLLNKYNHLRRPTTNQSCVFLLSDGLPLTMTLMNAMLAETLNPLFPGIGKFSTHSFRAGLPSLMGAFPQLLLKKC